MHAENDKQAQRADIACCGDASCSCTSDGADGQPVFCFGCRCVTWSPQARCEAIQDLLRPDEVLERALTLLPAKTSLGQTVGDWMLAAFVDGKLRYEPDPDDCDRWCSPAATLASGAGDCDDLAIVATAMLHALGVDADFVVGHVCNEEMWATSGLPTQRHHWICSGHAWVEGWDERGWFLLEATSGHLHRGARPDGYVAHLLLRPGLCRLAA